MKFTHRSCGMLVEEIYTEKDLDGDGVRRMHPDYTCESCGWIAPGEVIAWPEVTIVDTSKEKS